MQLVALERLPSIERAAEILIGLAFLRGTKAPLKGELAAARLTERWMQICCNLSVSASPSHLPFQGPIPPIRGKCPEGTKGVGMLSPKVTERLLQIWYDLSVSASPSHLPWKGRLFLGAHAARLLR